MERDEAFYAAVGRAVLELLEETGKLPHEVPGSMGEIEARIARRRRAAARLRSLGVDWNFGYFRLAKGE